MTPVAASRPSARARAWRTSATTQVSATTATTRSAAAGYALRNRVALSHYLEDGRLPVDNNAVERSLRRVAVGRKNWGNVGNEDGGRRAAVLYSLVQTCREIGVNPTEYFRDVLIRVRTGTDVAKLTPHGWKTHFMAEVHARRQDALGRITFAPR